MKHAALITGASAGLGAEYARLFAADQYPLVLVARRAERLEALAGELRLVGVEVHVLPMDLSKPGAADRVHGALRDADIEVDFLVNNAGFGKTGALAEMGERLLRDMIQVNIAALTELTRLFVPHMLRQGRGRILNIGSTAGFQPGPHMAAYYASKAFVNSFSEALSEELKNTGVTVTLSCPGATATEFAEISGNDRSLLFKARVADAHQVVREGYRAMMRGEAIVVHGFKNKFGVQALRFSPRSLVRKVAAKLNRVP